MLTKEEQKLARKQFYDSLEEWLANGNKRDWDNMFNTIYSISVSLFKRRARGIRLPNLEERALDATIYSMDLIRRGKYPTTGLIAWCDSQVKGEAYCESNKRIDREYSYDALTDHQLEALENGYFIGEINV